MNRTLWYHKLVLLFSSYFVVQMEKYIGRNKCTTMTPHNIMAKPRDKEPKTQDQVNHLGRYIHTYIEMSVSYGGTRNESNVTNYFSI